MEKWNKPKGRKKRHLRIRNKIEGSVERPRLNIRRSLSHLYAQIVDDASGKTLASISTLSPDVKESIKTDAGNVKGAVKLGQELATICAKKGIKKVVFDRAGYAYHGRVKAFAEAARKGGLDF